MHPDTRLKIAVVGTGISGLSAAWLLSQRHDVTVYERADRVGGHSNTILATVGGQSIPVDTGFIMFNRMTYPNLAALFGLLQVPTQASDMSFRCVDGWRRARIFRKRAIAGVFAQPRNLFRPRMWSMLADLARFYREAPARCSTCRRSRKSAWASIWSAADMGEAFRDDHLLPMASAIWSAAPDEMLSYPAAAFIRFHDNHGLLQLRQRPAWETVVGGSRTYVERLTASFADRIKLDAAVREVRRVDDRVIVTDLKGRSGTLRSCGDGEPCGSDARDACRSEPRSENSARLVPL